MRRSSLACSTCALTLQSAVKIWVPAFNSPRVGLFVVAAATCQPRSARFRRQARPIARVEKWNSRKPESSRPAIAARPPPPARYHGPVMSGLLRGTSNALHASGFAPWLEAMQRLNFVKSLMALVGGRNE